MSKSPPIITESE